MSDIHAMNGLKLYVSSIVALVAAVRFAFSGSINWYHDSIALVGVAVGGYLAARNSHHIPAQWIRVVVIVYGVFMTGHFFWGRMSLSAMTAWFDKFAMRSTGAAGVERCPLCPFTDLASTKSFSNLPTARHGRARHSNMTLMAFWTKKFHPFPARGEGRPLIAS